MNRKQAINYLSGFVRTRERLFAEEDRDVGDELGRAIKLLLKEVKPMEKERG